MAAWACAHPACSSKLVRTHWEFAPHARARAELTQTAHEFPARCWVMLLARERGGVRAHVCHARTRSMGCMGSRCIGTQWRGSSPTKCNQVHSSQASSSQ